MPRVPRDDETLDSIFRGRVRLIQGRRGYRFSLDAPLLAHFAAQALTSPISAISPSATTAPQHHICDIGCGSGIIGLALASVSPRAHVTLVELQPTLAARATRAAALNRLTPRATVICDDIRAFAALAPNAARFDLVVANPPYFPRGTGRLSAADEKAIARHEVALSLDELVIAAARLVTPDGAFCVVYPAPREADLRAALAAASLHPHRTRHVTPFAHVAPELVLLEARKHPSPAPLIEPPLTLHPADKRSQYSDAAAHILDGLWIPPPPPTENLELGLLENRATNALGCP